MMNMVGRVVRGAAFSLPGQYLRLRQVANEFSQHEHQSYDWFSASEHEERIALLEKPFEQKRMPLWPRRLLQQQAPQAQGPALVMSQQMKERLLQGHMQIFSSQTPAR
jgi:hypothetical protein